MINITKKRTLIKPFLGWPSIVFRTHVSAGCALKQQKIFNELVPFQLVRVAIRARQERTANSSWRDVPQGAIFLRAAPRGTSPYSLVVSAFPAMLFIQPTRTGWKRVNKFFWDKHSFFLDIVNNSGNLFPQSRGVQGSRDGPNRCAPWARHRYGRVVQTKIKKQRK